MRLAISVVLGLLLLIGAYFLGENIKNSKKTPKGKLEKITNVVSTLDVKNENIPIKVYSNGTLKAANKMELFSEVQGVLKQQNKAFKPGQYYSKGDLILQMDSEEFNSSLIAERSLLYDKIVSIMPDLKFDHKESFNQWDAYLSNFDIKKSVPPLPEPINEKEKYYINGKQIVSNYYSIKNLEQRLNKYRIYAPFSGMLSESLVDPGTLVRSGQKLGQLISNSSFELEVNVNSEFLKNLQIGKRVAVKDLEGDKVYSGKLIRINKQINPTTQTVQAFVRVSGAGLTDGMFLEATIDGNTATNVVEIPRQLLVDENKVLIVKNDSVLHLETVLPIHFSDKNVIIKGLKDGTQLLNTSLPGAYEGMIVKINP